MKTTGLSYLIGAWIALPFGLERSSDRGRDNRTQMARLAPIIADNN
jgi:hypothetical protein